MVTVIDLSASVTIPWPSFSCPCSGSLVLAEPILFGMFPATPKDPHVLFSIELLVAVGEFLRHACVTPGKLSRTLQRIHLETGSACERATPAAWRNLQMAAEQWRRVNDAVQSQEFAGLSLNLGGPRCAACWRVLRAVMGDACMGLTRLASRGLALAFRKPEREGLFLNRASVDAIIAEDAEQRRDASGARPCTDHAAAKAAISVAGKKRVFYDRKGIGLLTCRHGQARACSHESKQGQPAASASWLSCSRA